MSNISKDLKAKAQSGKRALDKQGDNIIPKDTLDFNPTLLPDSIVPYIKNVARSMDNAPISFAGITALTVLSIAIGARVGVRPKLNDDWTVIPNLWGAMIAPPSIKKTPIYTEMLKPLKGAEFKENEKYKSGMKEYKIEKDIYDAEYKTYKKEKVEGKSEISLPTIGNPPTHTRYIINDATIEKVGEVMKDNPKGLLVSVDELSGFFSTLNKAGREGDRAFWLSAWGGDSSHTIDRIQRGTFTIPNVCASIFGTIQPDSILNIVEDSMKVGAGDGMIQRFQLIAIESENNYKYTDIRPNYEAKKVYSDLVHKILYDNPIDYGAKADEYNNFLFYRFTPKANELFKDWSIELNSKIQRDQEHNPSLASHLGKFGSLFNSLALILFYSDRVLGVTTEDTIPMIYAQRAKELCSYFEAQAIKLYDLGAIKENKGNALRDKLLTKLRELEEKKELPITYGRLSQKVRGVKVNECRKLLEGHIQEENKRIIRLLD